MRFNDNQEKALTQYLTLYQFVHNAIFCLTVIGTFFWAKSLIYTDIQGAARRLFTSFGPTKDDLKKMANDKWEGVVGVISLLIGAVLQVVTINWQENFYYIINPNLHVNNVMILFIFWSLLISLLFGLTKLFANIDFEIAKKERMKAVLEECVCLNISDAAFQVKSTARDLFDLQINSGETDFEYIKRIAARVGYKIPFNARYSMK